MDVVQIAKYIGFSLLIISIIVYVFVDPVDRLLSYQGPILSGGLLGWYTLISNTPREKFIENDGEKIPVVSLLMRKRAIIFVTLGLVLIIPWLMPQIYPVVLKIQWLFVISFLCEFLGGFVIGYIIPSLKFTEKLLLFSLGFAGDTIYLLLLYLASDIFNIPYQLLLNSVIILVYGIKFPEGIVFAIYIMRKIGGI
ncbi:DUF1404 domain-containing protein [Saccharolobus solfataricus]|uniref:DUF1404 domain-containing protein n=3 Tax=Saccharolobus solfataricus TaxID=2287 RepID=Q97W11_SACS2|nr:DUF1404 family protein [Saccharolobus solfataricus]AAK42579.1 Hypothetical protein SSO2436 [Saccharolobus solfataricus P2]AKA72671.1 DUF1404 domain-containing protein [Saccharolobus solfataricus]AKA75371.1 DUF1404 domain-containing protein [Saccharolobus solfataricus]AKA78063.1 DUF1404 domain-containing protein [Saccharolobus solfataricus]AZF67184.1 DUF1404 domain-containing protein [Saccharolobus solfataricus]